VASDRNEVQFVYKGKDQMSKTTKKVSQGLKTLVKSVAKLALALVAAVGGMNAFLTKLASIADEAAKMSLRLGIAVDKLTAFHFAADLSGLSARKFNLGLQRMVRSLATAATEGGPVLKVLNKMGVSAKRLTELSPDKAFLAIAAAAGKLRNQGQKVKAFFDIFGMSGVGMLQMLSGGTKGIKDMMAEAKKFGVVIDKNLAKKSENFIDSLARVKAGFQGIGFAISGEVGPMFTELNNMFANWLVSVRDGIVSFVKFVVRLFLTVKIFIVDLISAVGNFFKGLVDPAAWKRFGENAFSAVKATLTMFINFSLNMMRILVSTFKLIWNTFTTLGKWAMDSAGKLIIFGFLAMTKSIVLLFKKMWQAIVSMGKWAWGKIKGVFTGEDGQSLSKLFITEQKKINIEFSKGMDKLKDKYIKTLPSFSKAIDDVTKSAKNSFMIMSAQGKKLNEDLTNDFVNTAKEVENTLGFGMVGAWNKAGKAMEELKIKHGDLSKSMEDANKGVTNSTITLMNSVKDLWSEQIKTQGKQVDTISKSILGVMNTTVDALSNAVATAIVFGGKLSEALKNILKSVLVQIISMYVKMAIQRKITALFAIKAGTALSISEQSRAAAATWSNAFASTAAIPIVGPALAPGVAAASLTAMLSGVAAAKALGAVAGIAHGGLTNVPRESTYLLNKGERVLSPNQNSDLTNFIGGGNKNGSVTIENLEVIILPNATSAESLLNMSSEEMERVVAGPIIKALDKLSNDGVRPEFASRGRRV